MSRVYSSYAIGQLAKCIKTPNSTYVITGEIEDYRCEIVEGDIVSILKHDGAFTDGCVISIDPENFKIVLENIGEVDIRSLMFIGV